VTACLFYHSQELLSTPFQNFFQSFFCGVPPEDSSPRQLPYSITSSSPCQPLFSLFPEFRRCVYKPRFLFPPSLSIFHKRRSSESERGFFSIPPCVFRPFIL